MAEEEAEMCGDNTPIPNPNCKTRKSQSKRPKGLKEDHISSLPDDVILHILSFLPTTEDTMQTGRLSRRWRQLWTSLPNLLFKYDGLPSSREALYDFYGSVNRALVLHKAPKINTFSLTLADWPDGFEFSAYGASKNLHSLLSEWLRFAADREVEELHLQLPNLRYAANIAVIPCFLYAHSSFTKLSTCDCDYNMWHGGGRQVGWKLLKELTISKAKFEDGALQMILSGCPLLEELVLRYCYFVTKIDAASNVKLKRVVLEQVLGSPDSEVEISIPSVTTLEISGKFYYRFKYNLLNVSSLEDVTLDYDMTQFHLDENEDILS